MCWGLGDHAEHRRWVFCRCVEGTACHHWASRGYQGDFDRQTQQETPTEPGDRGVHPEADHAQEHRTAARSHRGEACLIPTVILCPVSFLLASRCIKPAYKLRTRANPFSGLCESTLRESSAAIRIFSSGNVERLDARKNPSNSTPGP